MTESKTHNRFALSPHVTPGRAFAAALVTVALTPAWLPPSRSTPAPRTRRRTSSSSSRGPRAS